jgi:hypothetical protein
MGVLQKQHVGRCDCGRTKHAIHVRCLAGNAPVIRLDNLGTQGTRLVFIPARHEQPDLHCANLDLFFGAALLESRRGGRGPGS